MEETTILQLRQVYRKIWRHPGVYHFPQLREHCVGIEVSAGGLALTDGNVSVPVWSRTVPGTVAQVEWRRCWVPRMRFRRLLDRPDALVSVQIHPDSECEIRIGTARLVFFSVARFLVDL